MATDDPIIRDDSNHHIERNSRWSRAAMMHYQHKAMHPDRLKTMFQNNFTTWCQAGVARKLPNDVYYDEEGRIVNQKSSTFGLSSSIQVTHPEYILYGEEFVLDIDPAYVKNSSQLPRMDRMPKKTTILPLLSFSGDPVVCVVVFAGAGKKILALWHSGLDVTVDPICRDDQVDFLNIANYGPGKYFPSGPVCQFRGTTIPTLVYQSPSGYLTSDILRNVLKTLDELGVYERGPGLPEPCCLLDGFRSRLSFNEDLLQYCNDSAHKWNITLGVPQLAAGVDANEATTAFRRAFAEKTLQLLEFQCDMGWEPKVEPTDLMPLIQKAWAQSLAQSQTNRQALAQRGWYPPTRKLLQDVEQIRAMKQEDYRQSRRHVLVPRAME
ncbi:hypothetical protein FisN_UnNu072 [Fistulifera solaris]|uniref:Uncharacterized protein n=1 Tax=Fistulifera solaris TaxID=1519565 RepID=A0A1Z5JQ66_FISSO|nr:hypothetical protein FisN_UnNu072 [Fistulifera solaris]|eukprot:GAX15921.1 hypothetical protein FisN_UnNu072 [Fistulifera solaris]